MNSSLNVWHVHHVYMMQYGALQSAKMSDTAYSAALPLMRMRLPSRVQYSVPLRGLA